MLGIRLVSAIGEIEWRPNTPRSRAALPLADRSGDLSVGASCGAPSPVECGSYSVAWIIPRRTPNAGEGATAMAPMISVAIPLASIASMPLETCTRSPNTTTPSAIPATGSPTAIAGSEARSGAALNAFCISQKADDARADQGVDRPAGLHGGEHDSRDDGRRVPVRERSKRQANGLGRPGCRRSVTPLLPGGILLEYEPHAEQHGSHQIGRVIHIQIRGAQSLLEDACPSGPSYLLRPAER
jgi:hypothetical protein